MIFMQEIVGLLLSMIIHHYYSPFFYVFLPVKSMVARHMTEEICDRTTGSMTFLPHLRLGYNVLDL